MSKDQTSTSINESMKEQFLHHVKEKKMEMALDQIGQVIGAIIVEAILAGVFYAILALMIGLSVTYLQVFGVLLLLRLLVTLAKMS